MKEKELKRTRKTELNRMLEERECTIEDLATRLEDAHKQIVAYKEEQLTKKGVRVSQVKGASDVYITAPLPGGATMTAHLFKNKDGGYRFANVGAASIIESEKLKVTEKLDSYPVIAPKESWRKRAVTPATSYKKKSVKL